MNIDKLWQWHHAEKDNSPMMLKIAKARTDGAGHFKLNFDNLSFDTEVDRNVFEANLQQFVEGKTLPIQEAWEAAGGNPDVHASKAELLSTLHVLDKVCEEALAVKLDHPVMLISVDDLFLLQHIDYAELSSEMRALLLANVRVGVESSLRVGDELVADLKDAASNKQDDKLLIVLLYAVAHYKGTVNIEWCDKPELEIAYHNALFKTSCLLEDSNECTCMYHEAKSEHLAAQVRRIKIAMDKLK